MLEKVASPLTLTSATKPALSPIPTGKRKILICDPKAAAFSPVMQRDSANKSEPQSAKFNKNLQLRLQQSSQFGGLDKQLRAATNLDGVKDQGFSPLKFKIQLKSSGINLIEANTLDETPQ